ncbi:hypothetical protein AB4125_23505 [Vibrio splendidus]
MKEGKVATENVKLTCSVADKRFDYDYSVGDRVKFCRNEYRQLQVSNGTLGIISSITQLDGDVRLSILLNDNRTISFLASEYSDEIGVNLCHAYALTVFSSQGTTVDGNTFTLYSGRMAQREAYVALSRHKDESHIYKINERVRSYGEGLELTDELRQAELAKLMKQDNYSCLALEHIGREVHQNPFMSQLNELSVSQ